MASINFNAAEVEPSQEFQILPEGKYEAVISDSDVKSTRNGSGRYVQLEFEVVSGEHRGRRIWGRYNIENPSADAVRIGHADFSAVCHAVGVLIPSDTCELHGLPLVLTVKCRRQKDSDELENVIRGYAAKNAPVAAPALHPPDNRRRDADNSLKSCLDALTCARVYEDDSLIQRLTVTKKEPQPPDGLAVVRITEYEQKETRGACGAGPPVP